MYAKLKRPTDDDDGQTMASWLAYTNLLDKAFQKHFDEISQKVLHLFISLFEETIQNLGRRRDVGKTV